MCVRLLSIVRPSLSKPGRRPGERPTGCRECRGFGVIVSQRTAQHLMTKRRPKFVPNRVHVMADCQRPICIMVGITEFVVRLQNKFLRVERHCTVRVKT